MYDLHNAFTLTLSEGSVTAARKADPRMLYNLLTTISQVSCAVFYLDLVVINEAYDARSRYDLYDNLFAPANYFQLKKKESALAAAPDVGFGAPAARYHLEDDTSGWEAFIGELIDDVGVLGTRTKLYFLWQGLNCTLLIFRVLAATEFNKHLNFTFQTVSNCTSELGHFFAVYFVILVYYGMLAHILFGIQLEQYSDIWSSILIVNELAMPGSYDTGIMQYPTMSVRTTLDQSVAWIFLVSLVFSTLFTTSQFVLSIICDEYANIKDNFKGGKTFFRNVADIKVLERYLMNYPKLERQIMPTLQLAHSRHGFRKLQPDYEASKFGPLPASLGGASGLDVERAQRTFAQIMAAVDMRVLAKDDRNSKVARLVDESLVRDFSLGINPLGDRATLVESLGEEEDGEANACAARLERLQGATTQADIVYDHDGRFHEALAGFTPHRVEQVLEALNLDKDQLLAKLARARTPRFSKALRAEDVLARMERGLQNSANLVALQEGAEAEEAEEEAVAARVQAWTEDAGRAHVAKRVRRFVSQAAVWQRKQLAAQERTMARLDKWADHITRAKGKHMLA